MTILVTKRNGSQEPLDLNKLHKVVLWACEGLSGVSASDVEMSAQLNFRNGIKTSEIQEALIRSAAEKISEDKPNYQFVAGRLISYGLRKQVYGQFEPPTIIDHVHSVVEAGFYDKILLDVYDEQEWQQMQDHIDHDRDLLFAYAGMEQLRGKYLVKNRATGEILETPQMLYMLVAAYLFQRYPKETRMDWVLEFYDYASKHVINLPTPILAGVRTPQRQFASCVLIESDDDLKSIAATGSAIMLYVSQKAGIGIGGGKLRPVNSQVRNGDAVTTGVMPYYRYWQDAVKSCSQGGVRGGSATLYYPWFHGEVEDLLVLKNNAGTHENRLFHLDFDIQLNRLFYQRFIDNKHVYLFNHKDVPGMYEAFFSDQEKFEELYERAEKNPRLKKKKVRARDLMELFVKNRAEVGRIYNMNVDNVNTQGPFIPEVAPVRMSNLCTEVVLPTKPIYNVDDPTGEIATCILGAYNLGHIKAPEDFKRPAQLLVRALDELIDLQTYPMEAARNATHSRRFLGIGVVNLAYWLAKNDLTYQHIDEEGLQRVDELFEGMSYWTIKASIELAQEKGACDKINDTRYAQGLFPHKLRKKNIDELVSFVERYDWNALEEDAKKYGLRNSTLMACMPGESSAQLLNATNGVEPAQSLVTIKQSKDGILAQVVPEIRRLKNKYDLRWDQRSPRGYLKIMAVIQKWIDQAISVNTSYNPEFYEDAKLPMRELIADILFHYKYGGKTLYYNNIHDGAGEHNVEVKKADAPVQVQVPEQDDYCETCSI
jgi:ribonucleoside-diphosphate reductase alpha chain